MTAGNMRVLFDSTVLIAHLRGDQRATTMLLAHADDGAFASVVSRAEIEGGMRSTEQSTIGRLFDGITLVPVTDAIAQRAGAELRRFRRSHQGVDLADYLVGATALEHAFDLVTLNVKNFPMFPKLTAPW